MTLRLVEKQYPIDFSKIDCLNYLELKHSKSTAQTTTMDLQSSTEVEHRQSAFMANTEICNLKYAQGSNEEPTPEI